MREGELAARFPGGNVPLSWHVDAVTKYAHVAVPGEATGKTIGRWDAAMPFTVPDDLDDATILSLVDFIRTSPEKTAIPNGGSSGRVDGSMAITAIRRTGGGLQIDLQNQPLVEQRGGQWVILEVGFWIA